MPLVEAGGRRAAHIFDEATVDAVNFALAANRPLLVRGEPGSGKSQLARAVAQVMKRPFVVKVVDASTEASDLLYSFDAVSRLAQAQLTAALGPFLVADLGEPATGDDAERAKPPDQRLRRHVEDELHARHFTQPGPLWWAFRWKMAADRTKDLGKSLPLTPDGWSEETGGAVVLIDEIDKADGTVPNGLLGALGSGWFDEPGGQRIEISTGAEPPLIVLTTNEERVLPDAFVRRCIVLQIDLGDVRTSEGEAKFVATLVARGRAHFPNEREISNDVLQMAADQLLKDRRTLIERRLGLPGVAEFIDLLWGLRDMTVDVDPSEKEAAQRGLLKRLARFVFDKHPPRGR